MPTIVDTGQKRQAVHAPVKEYSGALPFLYTHREYPAPSPQAGSTTACKVDRTSPVSEYGPDD